MDDVLTQTFETRDDLVQAIKSNALAAGFVAVIGKSSADRHIVMRCDQSGVYRDRVNAKPGEKRRNTSTRCVNCEFFISASKSMKGTSDKKWHIGRHNLVHTGHVPSVDNLSVHPGARKPSAEVKERMHKYFDLDIPLQTVLKLVQMDNPGILLNIMDVRNIRMAYRFEKRAEAEIAELRSTGPKFKCDLRRDRFQFKWRKFIIYSA